MFQVRMKGEGRMVRKPKMTKYIESLIRKKNRNIQKVQSLKLHTTIFRNCCFSINIRLLNQPGYVNTTSEMEHHGSPFAL